MSHRSIRRSVRASSSPPAGARQRLGGRSRIGSGPASADVIGLRKGARGPAVKELQEALIRVGVGVVHGVDSYFGSATESSVKFFQRTKGLPVTGVVDGATAAALGLAAAPAPSPAPAALANGALARGARGDAVRRLQQSLTAAGITVAGGVDGIFGPATERAPEGLPTGQRADPVAAAPTRRRCSALQGGRARAAAARPPAPPGAIAFVGLRLGHRSPSVVALQQALINLGYSIRLGANGIFGTDTQNAVKQLQLQQGVGDSGRRRRHERHLGVAAAAAAPAAAPAPRPHRRHGGAASPPTTSVARASSPCSRR